MEKGTYKIIVHVGLVKLFTLTEATVKIIFAPAIVPLITRLEEQFTKYDIEQISVIYRVLMQFAYTSY